jgi:predicted nucleotide-binding protein
MLKEEATGTRRKFPMHSLEAALIVSQKIADEMGGKSFKRLLLADALGIKPSSTNFYYLLSSSYKYGLTLGTEKASEISLTDIGKDSTQTKDSGKRLEALRTAATTPEVFKRFYSDYADKKLPSSEMMGKILASEYGIPKNHIEECAKILIENGRFTEIVRDIGGSPHVLLDFTPENQSSTDTTEDKKDTDELSLKNTLQGTDKQIEEHQTSTVPRPIFIGHGKNKKPMEKLLKLLATFQIPHKVTVDEANLGRPIPQKVKDIMLQCGSAILIFTCDEKFYEKNGDAYTEVWKPSENVVHELGAASFAYGDKIVIFKEKGLHFPTNFQSIGYIEFDQDGIESKTAELLKELIGFGLVKITPTQ